MFNIPVGGLTIIVGLVSIFSGFRVFKVILALSFAFIGYVAAGYAIEILEVTQPDMMLLARIAGAMLFGGAAWGLFSLAIYLLGALFGLSVGSQVGGVLGLEEFGLLIASAAGALVGGSVASALKKPAVIFGTAFIGASLVIYGAATLLGFTPNTGELVPRGFTFVFWLGLGLLGSGAQWFQSRQWRREKDS